VNRARDPERTSISRSLAHAAGLPHQGGQLPEDPSRIIDGSQTYRLPSLSPAYGPPSAAARPAPTTSGLGCMPPLELVNGEPLAVAKVSGEIGDLRPDFAPDLFEFAPAEDAAEATVS
jgi:hypothetical protein